MSWSQKDTLWRRSRAARRARCSRAVEPGTASSAASSARRASASAAHPSRACALMKSVAKAT